MENLADKQVKIRKPHNCWGCRVIIPVGTTVRYTAVAEEGHITSCYWCGVCDEFMGTLYHWDLQDGFCYGDLVDMPDYPVSVTLKIGERCSVCGTIQEDWMIPHTTGVCEQNQETRLRKRCSRCRGSGSFTYGALSPGFTEPCVICDGRGTVKKTREELSEEL